MTRPLKLIVTTLLLCIGAKFLFVRGDNVETCESTTSANSTNDGMSSSLSSSVSNRLAILEAILEDDYDSLDETLSSSIALLKQRKAHLCWHKHSTFLEHLIHTHHLLRLWGESPVAGRLGLFHSAYSNSYVNLALLNSTDPNERSLLRDIIGDQAESLVYLYCNIDRQTIVIDTLLPQGYIPSEGMNVPHLRNAGETIHLPADILRLLVVFTIADFSDQYFGWQDELFDGTMVLPRTVHDPALTQQQHKASAIWPGISKPGLYMSFANQLCQVAKNIRSGPTKDENVNYGPIPPIFDDCTATLSRNDEIESRDLYWSIITGSSSDSSQTNTIDANINTLKESHSKNPWAFEPLVILGQLLMAKANDNDEQRDALIEEAREYLAKATTLQEQWGTSWDKRLSFGAWLSWTRVLYQRAKQNVPWPTNSWEVINFGLVLDS